MGVRGEELRNTEDNSKLTVIIIENYQSILVSHMTINQKKKYNNSYHYFIQSIETDQAMSTGFPSSVPFPEFLRPGPGPH